MPAPIPGMLGMTPIRARVSANHAVDAVEIEVANGQPPLTIVLSRDAALDAALRLVGAVIRLRKLGDDR
jgi:hypothetical protein